MFFDLFEIKHYKNLFQCFEEMATITDKRHSKRVAKYENDKAVFQYLDLNGNSSFKGSINRPTMLKSYSIYVHISTVFDCLFLFLDLEVDLQFQELKHLSRSPQNSLLH